MTTLEAECTTRVGATSEPLSAREKVVLTELGVHATLEEVARCLFVTRNTVKTQVRAIYRKLGVSTRAELRAWMEAHPWFENTASHHVHR
ncbi:response regulator transcription factor [Cellulomonas endometrii]|uniref:response regulator transcription factor n=1 Tax=Cellulomonas endometrii TaxID=3036301 RepID=UPI0024AD23FB|nr:LuxR C-terminal-related transcriptional regulator [Cellulomonas endometrii]